MKPSEIIDKIVEEGNLKDRKVDNLVQWIVENEGKQTLSKYISAIKEDDVRPAEATSKNQKKIVFNQLKHSFFFDRLAVEYGKRGWFRESEQLFEAILKRTPKDIGPIHDYGAMLVNWTTGLYKKGKKLDTNLLKKARRFFFIANKFQKKVSEDWRKEPAYKNLCFLRTIEAISYYQMKDLFTAFVLAWMSIEMSLYRIWFQYTKKQSTIRRDNLMEWNVEYIIESLCLNGIEALKKIKKDIDTLKGTRNRLIHGKIDNPTSGEVRRCINIAMKLIPILNP